MARYLFSRDEDPDPVGSFDFWTAGSGAFFKFRFKIGSDFFLQAEPDQSKTMLDSHPDVLTNFL